ncbi:MAG TPA: aldehyde dehydrogenase family protein, partial [Gemmatimonadaceae bacterium]|nr:aldehyde dehydrogenase family protein [Gemmatimonadaceae bacterium]
MRILCAVIAASACVVFGSASLAAQQQWNDARTMALVRAATERRGLQLADTALRDYSAQATGTVTFLAQFGDGALSRPIVVKSDQLALEVYWSAPDRSKQRIVGRRDTLLLPSDMQYHRDHLGIIQNNFPDIIRLGDGDEVLDVVHPLSPSGPATYDYAIDDSLAIRGGGLSIDVMMVRVRPKDPRRPAAVGAVYLDRSSGSVVRMTFSFTRAALRDRQLEDVSVILENGLVDGRFWLPRRQEIEIRRSASWMDFPAKGIIRGRWEICCVETNQSPDARVFRGPEIVEAGPPDELRRHPSFTGEVLDALPEDVRALDADEVRAVQDEARRLVQESALRRVRSGNLMAGRISDFVRSDRVEGLALGAGLSQRLGGGLTAAAQGRYGFADHRWKGQGSLEWRSASGWSLRATGIDDWRQLGEVAEVSGIRNAIAAQEFGSDWTQPIGVVGMITPWNWPLNQIALKVAPALAAGNTMILKPSEECPGNAVIFAEILDAAGVPPGVFNLVQGDGPTVGNAISSHPGIEMVSFTGSTRAGILVAKAAADTVK